MPTLFKCSWQIANSPSSSSFPSKEGIASISAFIVTLPCGLSFATAALESEVREVYCIKIILAVDYNAVVVTVRPVDDHSTVGE